MVKRHYGVRDERWKLIHFYDDIDVWELYDLEADPRELHNLFGNPAYAARAGADDEGAGKTPDAVRRHGGDGKERILRP